jgi:UDP-N-acetylglucosamine 2-epimerase (non-hydrolysing)/GDP/UDP-N,N'-diacetylbacillosamine 2-epimerase (hydrolysing)
MPTRLLAVTGTRAEYGLVRPILQALHADQGFEVGLIVTGTHLADAFGRTVEAIEADGLPITARIDILEEADDTGVGVARAVGRAIPAIAEAFERFGPDLVLLVGDRFEQLAAAQAALFLRLPIVHLFGGDITEGAFDDSMRHAITKLAHVHLVSNEGSARVVRQLGEDPARVHVVGSPAIDELVGRLPIDRARDRAALARELGIRFGEPSLLVTFHPATLDREEPVAQLDEILGAVDTFGPGAGIVVTKANADPGGRAVNARIDEWAADRTNVQVFDSLGNERYHALLGAVDAMVGNSSSGLYEAPSLGVPTVNVGDRQAGRLRAASVIDVAPEASAIRAGIDRALAGDWSKTVNPYGDGHATERIVEIIRSIAEPERLVRKRFHEVGP